MLVLLAEELTMTDVSAVVLGTLLLLLALASGMFYALVWRETSARRSLSLAEWARESGFYINPLARLRPPHPLERFGRPVRIGTCLVNLKCTAVDFAAEPLETSEAASVKAAAAAPVSMSPSAAGDSPGADASAPNVTPSPADVAAGSRPDAPRSRWRHVLIWPIEQDWPPVGLRPLGAADSIVDLLPLPSQAARYGTERFVIHTESRHAAATIAGSHLRALLPPDIGLVLLGKYLLLDFSCRPFDGIEINRMTFIAKQLAESLARSA